MATAVRKANGNYQFRAKAALLSTDEMTLLERVPHHVSADAVIAGSPWTGASLAYAIAGRRVLMPHTLMDITHDGDIINNYLNEAPEHPDVCAALAAEHVTHVLDFGSREVHGTVHDFPGLDSLSTSSAVELVDHAGEARLYKIVACG